MRFRFSANDALRYSQIVEKMLTGPSGNILTIIAVYGLRLNQRPRP
jgi:hypothetical protein